MEKKIPIYTDLKITPTKNTGVKRYFNSIKRNLPENWNIITQHQYNDKDSFEVFGDILCIKTPYYRDVSQEKTFYGTVFLGLADNYILLLRTEVNTEFIPEQSIQPIGYIISNLHEEVLKPNKHYSSFHHEFEFGGPADENWYKKDLRSQRQIRVNSKKDAKIYSLIKGTQTKVNGQNVFFNEPNNISLCLSIMKKSYKNARRLFSELKLNRINKKVEIKDDDIPKLYDYFEEIITGLTFSFIAVEAMANAAIPEEYAYEMTNEKGIKETWPKESIERWMSTSSKVSEILPLVLNSKNIKTEKFWVSFKKLESLRNEIVHQKTIEKGTKLDSEMFKQLIDPSIFGIIRSSLDVIGFFYKIDNAHPYFPLGLGIARFKIVDIESMEKHFKIIEEK
ncbi:hypothetical protein [Flagellimonas baculiformis]|uniref:hypothetical protein n=1 Tax=Flagellimonas baculiformis TaxID=3067310 RepID=UPI00296E5F28|nr:hypothetical protein [Muricauda sp. D6]